MVFVPQVARMAECQCQHPTNQRQIHKLILVWIPLDSYITIKYVAYPPTWVFFHCGSDNKDLKSYSFFLLLHTARSLWAKLNSAKHCASRTGPYILAQLFPVLTLLPSPHSRSWSTSSLLAEATSRTDSYSTISKPIFCRRIGSRWFA
jgi:hypothetical protein